MLRFGRILAFVIVVSLIFPLACAEEEPELEDPRDSLVELLQLTDEQLEQLETGTGTLQLREDQVDTLSDYVTQLLDDLQPWLDEAQWEEVKGILEMMLTQGEVDLQTLSTVAEAIHDSLVSEAEAGIGVYTKLVRLTAKSTATVEEGSQLAEGSERSTCVTVYTPRNSITGDKHYERSDYYEEETYRGLGGESIAYVDPYDGAIVAYSKPNVMGGAHTYTRQRILINVPADASDITINSRLLYKSGTFSCFPPPIGITATGIVTLHPLLSPPMEVSYRAIDPVFDWLDAVKWALLIATMGTSVTVTTVAHAITAILTGYDVLAYKSALEEYGEEEIVTYSADSLAAGRYIFEIGFYARAVSTIDIARAYVIGMVPEIEVTMDCPSRTLTVASTDGGWVEEPGEGTFPYCPEEDIDIVAISSPGCQFVEWTGDVGTVADVNSQITTISMNDNYSITANFEEIPPVQFDLTTSSTAGGSVTTPGEGTFGRDSGTVVDLVAVAEEGYYFVNWTGDVGTIADVNAATTNITMNGDYSITANFGEGSEYTSMVAGGKLHTVGLKTDGTVVAVGKNAYGQCNIDTWTDVSQVAAGEYHTAGLKSDGTMVAVGYNVSGQCNVGGWTDITQVTVGTHTVGLETDGTVVAVGNNYCGQCDVGGWTDITQVAAGYCHTVGLKTDGTVVAVGYNYSGQCDVGGWTDITQVTANYGHTVGLKADGTVVAVGDSYHGQCNVGSWTDITQIAAGYYHTVGLETDGTVVAVGDNVHGQCDVSGWTDITQIAAGSSHTVGLKSDGTVVAVGRNWEDQCDVGDWDLT